jgi:hypothetical protein
MEVYCATHTDVRTLIQVLLIHVDADVRQETTPKAGWLPMSVLASLAYAGAIIAFSVIFVSESHKSTTETLIMTTDNTGQDGYTCQMISKVTASYEILSAVGQTSQAFQLINFIESKSQYEADYTIADPCSEPLEFFFGSRMTLYGAQVAVYGGAALYGEDTAVVAVYATGPNVLISNYCSGHYYTYSIDANIIMDSIAVDTDAKPIFIASDAPGVYSVYRLVIYSAYVSGEELLYTATLPDQPIILNDNLYNIYLAEHDTFTALDVYASPASNTTLFTTRDGEFIRYAAVYHSGSTVKVYYINNTDGANVWEGGVFTDLGHQKDCTGIAVDGADNYYYLYTYAGMVIAKYLHSDFEVLFNVLSLCLHDNLC